jgi:FAD:protein FMN transferase
MKISKQNLELKRMRPFLGTFVEISIDGADSKVLADCIEMGFSEIARVENLMSRFRIDSEVGRFNNLKMGEGLRVSEELSVVLRLSEELHILTHGIFDVTLGAGKIFKIEENILTRLAPGFLDLGGIAKGYAVDQAVKVMEDYGVSGMVNAGGDLRVFGRTPKEILLQKISEAGPRFFPVEINNMAVATSNLRTKGNELLPAREQRTVSIFADTCMIADALTKVALQATSPANSKTLEHCLQKYNARAFSA